MQGWSASTVSQVVESSTVRYARQLSVWGHRVFHKWALLFEKYSYMQKLLPLLVALSFKSQDVTVPVGRLYGVGDFSVSSTVTLQKGADTNNYSPESKKYNLVQPLQCSNSTEWY